MSDDVMAIAQARDKYLLQLKRINDILHPNDGVAFQPHVKIAVELRCSFCNKDQHEVAKLIAGPSVFICDECVGVCIQIIAETGEARAPQEEP